MAAFKAVVTDYIEPDLNMEAKRLQELGIEFEAFQLNSVRKTKSMKPSKTPM